MNTSNLQESLNADLKRQFPRTGKIGITMAASIIRTAVYEISGESGELYTRFIIYCILFTIYYWNTIYYWIIYCIERTFHRSQIDHLTYILSNDKMNRSRRPTMLSHLLKMKIQTEIPIWIAQYDATSGNPEA